MAPASPMTEPSPRYYCAACHRNVINREFPRCLYCDAVLPAEVLLPAGTMRAQADAGQAAAMPQASGAEQRSALADIADGIDVIELVADGIDLLGGLID